MEDSITMKLKRIAFIFFIFLFLAGNYNLVWGERFSVHANGGYSFPREKNMSSGWESGFGFSYAISKKIFASFDFGFWKSGVDGEPGKLLDGKMSANPFLLSLQYYLYEKRNFLPYVFMGVGYVFYDFKLEDIITIPELTITQKIDNGLSLHAGLGAVIQISEKLSFFGEALYFYRKADATTTRSDLNLGTTTEKFSIDTSASIIRLGLKYLF
jgi:outer membrane protein W